MLHPRRVERRAPAALVVLRQLQIEALAVHSDGHVADAGPRVQLRAKRPERSVVRGHGTSSESDCCPEELAAWVEHALLDDLVGSHENGLRDGQAQRFGRAGAFIQDAGRRFAAIPHIRPGHADLAAGSPGPADPRRAPTSREGSAMTERFVGIDVGLREHRAAVLDRDGEAVGPSFTIAASQDGGATLLRALDARDATPAQTQLHKGHINIDPASVYTAAAIDADIRALSCMTVAFAAVEDDAHVTPVLKLSAQLFISVQPGTDDDEDEHSAHL